MNDSVAVPVPQINPNDEQAVLVCWHVKSGARVNAGDVIATLETTKAAFDVDAPKDGFVFFRHAPRTMLPVGAPLAYISSSNEPPPSDASAAREPGAAETISGSPRFTRKALKLMRAQGLAEGDFPSEGQIDAEEVERLIRQRVDGSGGVTYCRSPQAVALEQAPSKLLEIQALRETHRHAIPSTVAISLSCARVEAKLRHVGDDVGPLTLLELALFETGRLLYGWPELNGFYENGRAWSHGSVGVGFAINLRGSLRVPVVRSSSSLSQRQVVTAVRDLALRYMRDELRVEDLAGGTFTITDLSSFGVVHFVPVLNHRQSAILGICAERPGTGARDLVLSFDHRLTDGMRAAAFLNALRDRLEHAAD